MKLNFSHWSLKTRIMLFTLAIFLAGIWSLSFYASRMLERDMQRLLGDQQFSTASYVADQINGELNDRIQYLQAIADSITPALLHNPAKLQAFLEQKILLQLMFNAGVFIIQSDGTALADVPLSAGRTGGNYKDRDFVIPVLTEGKVIISQPHVSKKQKAPVFSMTVPVKDGAGKVIGALVAVINLGQPNFLDRATENAYGKGGGYALIVRDTRLIISATDKRRIMQSLPAAGVNPTLDRFLAGYEGSAVFVTPLGVEVLFSAKAVPVAGWLLRVNLPTTEAFAPIHEMQRRVLFATLFFTLLAGGLIWWMLRRQLSPMLTAVQTMSTMASGNQPPQALPVTRQDEIGMLITGFNRLLEALLATNKRLNEAQQLAHLGNWSADMVSGELYWSDEIYHIFGHKPGSFAPSVDVFKAAVHPDDVTLVEESEKTAQQTGLHDVVHRIVRPDGSVRYVHELAQAEFDAAGKMVRLSGTVQDVTEIKQAELALLATTDRLNDAQRMARIGNWSLDLQSGELIWSDEIFHMFEIDPNKFGATYEAFMNAIHPDDRAAVDEAYSKSLVTREPYEITHRLRMADGRIKWVVEKCMSDFDAEGKPWRSRGMVQDITQLKQVELELIAARDVAEQASKAKSDFLSSMSHELRTPMNAILGFAQILDCNKDISDEQRVCVKEILGAGFHLIELINEVLDLSQIESGNLKLSMESVLVCDVVEDSISLVNVLADKRNIKISHAGLEGVTVHADRIRLKQALLNLLSNAIKYNREGGSVRVEVKKHGENRLHLLVRDTGMGISAAKMPDVFQAFNRLGAENSNIMGAGIGLTITRRIIEMMGGSVGAESEEGVGSLFWIELPTEFLPVKARETPAMQSKDTELQPPEPSKYNVLYIEDNPSNLRLVTQLFSQRKYIHLVTAHTPELGIDLATAQRPDLILLDINMPGMSGYQVLEVFKRDKRLEGVPVIAVTASAMVSDIERGMAAGFGEYLTKPLDIGNFYSVIDRYLPVVGHHNK